ncbi:MAG: hypothetical protein KAR20_27635, partial [Candidatus Heimdallarchaeota archaeon]|nr:hypothetical protein [Candidatus Heimdallarchaeota archaeon]
LTSGTQKAVEQIRRSVKLLANPPMSNSMFHELGMVDSEEMHLIVMEGPRILYRMITMCLERKGH